MESLRSILNSALELPYAPQQQQNNFYSHHDEELFSSSSDEDTFLIEENSAFDNFLESKEVFPQQQTSLETNNINVTNNNNDQPAKLQVFIKQAKGKDDQYDIKFPSSLLCHPYKYDLKVVGEIKDIANSKLVVSLVDSETYVIPNVSLPNKKTVENIAVEQIEEVQPNERLIRFTFKLCSFHFKRRSFRLELTQEWSTGKKVRLYLSDPFQTFARRREHHFGSKPTNTTSTSTASVASTTSVSPIHSVTSPTGSNDASNCTSNSSNSVNSNTAVKQGVKRSLSSANAPTHVPYPTNNKTIKQQATPTNPTTTTAGHPMAFPVMFPQFVYPQDMTGQYVQFGAGPVYYMPTPYANNQLIFSPPQIMSPEQKSNILVEEKVTSPRVKKELRDKPVYHKPLNFVQPAVIPPITSPTTCKFDMNYFASLESKERTSFAIQLMKSLSPTELQTVNSYLN
ncbi:hypothetical protein ABK040_015483 [Willaertia magna]